MFYWSKSYHNKWGHVACCLKKNNFLRQQRLQNFNRCFYHQLNYTDDGCVSYDCMELKHDNDVKKMLSIYSEFNTKGSIELNATFGRSLDEILAQLCKPKKPRTTDEIIALMLFKKINVYSNRLVESIVESHCLETSYLGSNHL